MKCKIVPLFHYCLQIWKKHTWKTSHRTQFQKTPINLSLDLDSLSLFDQFNDIGASDDNVRDVENNYKNRLGYLSP